MSELIHRSMEINEERLPLYLYVATHEHPIVKTLIRSNKNCDCDGITRHCTGIIQAQQNCYSCPPCGFNICLQCTISNAGSSNIDIRVSNHPHVLRKGVRLNDGRWGCDGRFSQFGCFRNCTGLGQSRDWINYCCVNCDFDLCDECIVKYAGNNQPLIRVSTHDHLLSSEVRVPGQWRCDGRHLDGGCKSTIEDPEPDAAAASKNYCCFECDYDLCGNCMVAYAGVDNIDYKVSIHPHPLRKDVRDNNGQWLCDGSKMPGRCRSGLTRFGQSRDKDNFCCIQCDFDLCRRCLQLYSDNTNRYYMGARNRNGIQEYAVAEAKENLDTIPKVSPNDSTSTSTPTPTTNQVDSIEANDDESFLCPITLEVMKDPVICLDGFTYERSAIQNWFRTSSRSPQTNLPLPSKTLIPNRALLSAIQAHYSKIQKK